MHKLPSIILMTKSSLFLYQPFSGVCLFKPTLPPTGNRTYASGVMPVRMLTFQQDYYLIRVINL